MRKNHNIILLSAILLFLFGFYAQAQQGNANQKLLAEQPNFLKHPLKASDSLFVQDIAVLKKFVFLDSLDEEMLKPRILLVILSDSQPTDSTITYQKLIDAIQTFKKGIGYTEFRKGVLLYKEMAALIVNPENWGKDQLLFKRLGFTEADLEDFLLFISKLENKKLNYKQAYLAYMKEIDSLQ